MNSMSGAVLNFNPPTDADFSGATRTGVGLAGTSFSGIELVQFLPIDTIREAIENGALYNTFTTANEDDRKFAEAVKINGVLSPLHVSRDGVLLDGHRRLAAARLAGLDAVPVIVDEIIFDDLEPGERLKVLVGFNPQRDKSFDERIAEAAVEVDPDAAYRAVISYRAERAEVNADVNVHMGERRERAEITTRAFLNAVITIVNDARPNWPISNRAVHYRLLNDPPLTHDSKPGSVYKNMRRTKTNPTDYPQKLSSLLTRARIEGLIPMEAISDDERPTTTWKVHSNAAGFVLEQEAAFLQGYARDLLQSQPHHIEIVVEKKTQYTATKNVASNFTIPVTAGKGFASLAPRWAIAERFRASRKDKLILIFLTDFDPDGEQIASSFARSMRDDFGIGNVYPVKAALTGEQVKNFNLPSSLEAKSTSPNYKKFVARHGTRAVELEALPDDVFAELLRDAINSVLDVDAFNYEIEQERQETVELAARRKAVFELIRKGCDR